MRIGAICLSILAGLTFSLTARGNNLSFQQGVSGYSGCVALEIAAGSPYNGIVNGYSAGSQTVWVDYPNGTGQQAGSDILLRFNNIFGTGANQIPLGSTINSATVQLTTTPNFGGNGNGGTFNRMLTNWSGTDTWNSLGGVSGDDVKATSSHTGEIGAAQLMVVSGVQSATVTADLQAWANGATNNGWAILPWEGGQDGWGVWDQTFPTAFSARPLLTVSFTVPVPEPAAIVPAVVAAAWMLKRRRMRWRRG